jgi:glycosyltransferase involved in cell wall biosynthesis
MPTVETPLVSVVVPVFNAATHLRDSLDSILAQTYPRTEVIVVDDASTDATPDVLGEYTDRVLLYRQPERRGIYGNINDGIARASGDYVAVYHADDVYHPRIVEREAAHLTENTHVDAVFCKSLFIDPASRAYARRDSPPELQAGRALDHRTVVNALLTNMNRFLRCPSVMLRAASLREMGPFDEREYGGSADLDMWLRIAWRGHLSILDEYLLAYRIGHGNDSETLHRLRTDPRRYLEVMERCLRNEGRAVASAEALLAFEGHRARDILVRAIHHYLRDEAREARLLLDELPFRKLSRRPPLPRRAWRGWALLMHALARLPSSRGVRRYVHRRWGSGTIPSPRGRRRLPLPLDGENWNRVAERLPPL